MYVLALLFLTFIVFAIGTILFDGSNNPYTDFMLTFIAVYLVTSKIKFVHKE